jgi:hypothetical protein
VKVCVCVLQILIGLNTYKCLAAETGFKSHFRRECLSSLFTVIHLSSCHRRYVV